MWQTLQDGGFQSQSGWFVKEINLFHMPGIKPRFLDRLARSLGMKYRDCIGVRSWFVLLAVHCYNGTREKNEIGWAYGTQGSKEKCLHSYGRKLRPRHRMKCKMKMDFQVERRNGMLSLCGSGRDEYRSLMNELSNSIKRGKFLK